MWQYKCVHIYIYIRSLYVHTYIILVYVCTFNMGKTASGPEEALRITNETETVAVAAAGHHRSKGSPHIRIYIYINYIILLLSYIHVNKCRVQGSGYILTVRITRTYLYTYMYIIDIYHGDTGCNNRELRPWNPWTLGNIRMYIRLRAIIIIYTFSRASRDRRRTSYDYHPMARGTSTDAFRFARLVPHPLCIHNIPKPYIIIRTFPTGHTTTPTRPPIPPGHRFLFIVTVRLILTVEYYHYYYYHYYYCVSITTTYIYDIYIYLYTCPDAYDKSHGLRS